MEQREPLVLGGRAESESQPIASQKWQQMPNTVVLNFTESICPMEGKICQLRDPEHAAQTKMM